jgi:hypothetical protein
MTSASVWVQLYYKGETETESVGQSFRIEPIPQDVDALKKLVHRELAPELTHCSAARLKVYAAGTNTVPIPEGTKALNPGHPVPTNSTSDLPLIVIAKPSTGSAARS